MSGAARIQEQHIEVAGLAMPLAVLRQQLACLTRSDSPDPLELVLQSPALLLQMLAQHHSVYPAPLADSLRRIEPLALQHTLRHKALQLLLAEQSQDQVFLAWHWVLSRRIALYAAQLARLLGTVDPIGASACGLLLPSGMLAMQQLLGSAYSQAAPANWPQRSLLALEQVQWRLTHVELGTRLLESLGLDLFFVDALRYQALPFSQVLDAAPLVRLCWLAARLAETGLEASVALLTVGRQLLGLDAADLAALPARVENQLSGECAALGFPLLPSTAWRQQDTAELQNASRQQLQQLRHQVLAEDLLLRHGNAEPETPAALQARLASTLLDAGIEPVFILLCAGAEEPQRLEVLASHGTRMAPEGLSLVCTPGRSVLATLIERGEVETLSADSPDLTVIDRQLLSLLGGTRLVCEPSQAGHRRAALLLGMDAAMIPPYLAQGSLRRLLQVLLQRALQWPAAEDLPLSTLVYQQRVREAVHEAANPLTIIKNYLHLLSLRLGGEQGVPEELGLVSSEIDRIAAILQALRESEAAVSPSTELDLNALVRSMYRMFVAAFESGQLPGKGISFELALASGPVRVCAQANALKQVLTNLVKNAIEAFETGGIITLSTKAGVWQQGRLYGQVSVRDNGPGIAPDLMARLFSPGATTKGGRHKGSGLSIVKNLVDDLQGQISCQSDDEGTTLSILLPQAP